MIMVLGPTKKKADAGAEKAADRARRDDPVAPAPAEAAPAEAAPADTSTEAPAAEQPA
jgi:hypothetical protein